MSIRTRFTLACLAGATALAAAACAPLPVEAEVPPSETTTSTTTSTTTTVPEVDPNEWVGQCYPVNEIYGSLRVGTVLLDDGDHWVADFPVYASADCSGVADGIGLMAFGADAAEGAAACAARSNLMTDGGTMAAWWDTPMPPEARICVPDMP